MCERQRGSSASVSRLATFLVSNISAEVLRNHNGACLKFYDLDVFFCEGVQSTLTCHRPNRMLSCVVGIFRTRAARYGGLQAARGTAGLERRAMRVLPRRCGALDDQGGKRLAVVS